EHLAGVRPRRQLGGGAVDVARGDEARPTLVSGQPPASAAPVHGGPLRRASRALPDWRLLVRLGGAVVRLPEPLHRGGRRQRAARPRLLPARAEPLSGMAHLAARLGDVLIAGVRRPPFPPEGAPVLAILIRPAEGPAPRGPRPPSLFPP